MNTAETGTRLALTALWMAAIFAASSVPGERIPGEVGPYTRAVHVGEYSVLGLLVSSCLGPGHAVAAWGISAAYGASDELHQLFVPGRFCDPADLAADAFGAAAGALIYRLRVGP
jgi:hypothetical protein